MGHGIFEDVLIGAGPPIDHRANEYAGDHEHDGSNGEERGEYRPLGPVEPWAPFGTSFLLSLPQSRELLFQRDQRSIKFRDLLRQLSGHSNVGTADFDSLDKRIAGNCRRTACDRGRFLRDRVTGSWEGITMQLAPLIRRFIRDPDVRFCGQVAMARAVARETGIIDWG